MCTQNEKDGQEGKGEREKKNKNRHGVGGGEAPKRKQKKSLGDHVTLSNPFPLLPPSPQPLGCSCYFN